MTIPLYTLKKGGFTLIEALVAVTILTLAVIGPMMTANRAIVAQETARDRLIASYLAQEGVEHMRALRDDAYLAAYQVGGAGVSQTAWTNFRDDTSQCDATTIPTRACTYDSVSGLTIGPCFTEGEDKCEPLYLRPDALEQFSDARYTQASSGNTETAFTRTIQRFYISDTNERVVSTVSWTFHGTVYSVSTSVQLTPWQ